MIRLCLYKRKSVLSWQGRGLCVCVCVSVCVCVCVCVCLCVCGASQASMLAERLERLYTPVHQYRESVANSLVLSSTMLFLSHTHTHTNTHTHKHTTHKSVYEI